MMIKLSITEGIDDSVLQELNTLPVYKGIGAVTYGDLKTYEDTLSKFSTGTIIAVDWDAGTCYFHKIGPDKWEELVSPWYDLKTRNSFDIAEWLAGRGNYCKKPLWIDREETFNELAKRKQSSYGNSDNTWLMGPADKRNFGQYTQKKDLYGF